MPEKFECAVCEVRHRSAGLFDENHEAWALWARMGNRTVVDLHLGGWVLEQVTADMSPKDKLDLLQRLTLIRETLDPPRDDRPPYYESSELNGRGCPTLSMRFIINWPTSRRESFWTRSSKAS